MSGEPQTCLVCGRVILNGGIVARVDDGRAPKTPNRWREVGMVHEGHCEQKFLAGTKRNLKKRMTGNLKEKSE